MTDLTDFLMARIGEDEEQLATARRLGVPPIPGGSRMFSGIGNHPTVSETRLAAECEAKRQIVEDLRDELANQHDPEPTTLQLAERTLLTLALPYADHPEYRAEWKP